MSFSEKAIIGKIVQRVHRWQLEGNNTNLQAFMLYAGLWFLNLNKNNPEKFEIEIDDITIDNVIEEITEAIIKKRVYQLNNQA